MPNPSTRSRNVTSPATVARRRTRIGQAARVVAVSLVLNFEEGGEFTVSEGDAVNEGIYEVDHRLDGPDPCVESHFEYGTRAAWWRIMDLFDVHGVKVTVSSCGRAVERSPDLARDAVSRGHEVSAHGWRWESHAGMDEADERRVIARTVAAIEHATGQRPLGWHTRSATSLNTRRLLVEEGGFLYDSDAYNDDLPYDVSIAGQASSRDPLRIRHQRHAVLPTPRGFAAAISLTMSSMPSTGLRAKARRRRR